jgi:acyl-coenzyme A thioesterase PaaI-like protein
LPGTQGEGQWRGHAHEAYGNRVRPFGGATAAAGLAAVLAHPARQGEPIALTVNSAGPVAQGPLDVEATVVRTNRSPQHWSVRMRQGAHLVATATAVLSVKRWRRTP